MCRYYRTLIFSHRGRCRSREGRIDNTLGAIEQIRKAGIRGVEIDLWLLRDNETVLFHDSEFYRTGKRKRVSESTMEDLDLSSVTGNIPGKKKRIWQKWKQPPDLITLLDSFPELFFNLELKFEHNEGLREREILWLRYLVGLLSIRKDLDRIIISSFNWDAVDFIKKSSETLQTGYLFEENLLETAIKRGLRNSIYSLHPHISLVNETLLEKARVHNFKVIVWTVNKPDEMEELFKIGVDGIITDYPLIAARIRENLCGNSST